MSRASKPNRSKKRPSRRRGGNRGMWLFVTVPAVLIVVAGVVIANVFQGGSSSIMLPAGITFPAYIRSSPFAVQEAYAYAIERPDMLQYIPCYCGCGTHSGHTSIHDCFVKYVHITGGGVAFDDHGANCDMCVDIIREAKKRTGEGQTVQQIRQYVVDRYGNTGPATNTPPIP